MPVLETFRTNTGIKAALWELTENPDELLQLGNLPLYVELFNKYHNTKRQKEVLAARLLLRELTGKDFVLDYSLSGCPYLPANQSRISVSHTYDIVAVALHQDKNIGIDVEKIGEKVERVSSKFIGKEESFLLNPIGLHLAWSIKEALYKALQTESIDFREHLHIHSFNLQESGDFTAHETRTPRKITYEGHYKIYPSFVLAYCIPH